MALIRKTLRQAIESRGVKLALYGGSGVGKTTQIAAILALLPEEPRVQLAIITAEHGLLTLGQTALGMIDDPRVEVMECTSIGDVREAVGIVKNPANGYAFVVVDSVSNIAHRELSARLEAEKDPRKAYGEMQQGTLRFLWQLVDVEHLNVLFIFQEHRDEINMGTANKPDMVAHYSVNIPSDSLKQDMPFIFDAVLRMEMVGDKRQIRTARTSTIMAKDRSGTLAPIEPADLGAIITKIRAGTTGK